MKRQKIHQKDGVYCADPTGVAMMGFLHEAGQRDDTSWQIFSWVGGGIIFVVLIPYFGGYLRIFKALENRAVHCR